ncbi:MAG TPA: uroporphyrinogen-III synthase [Methylophilus sp.]|nr:uroporphyrinogen-III synthase [Methylophilus sp.]HQQ32303.1 uroporphyrinogen-III synthase [Methylophilus sp.]
MTEQRLAGIHIAVTRPIEQAQALNELITHLGGVPIPYPLLAIQPLEDYHAFEQQILGLENTDWAIFISTNAVEQSMPRILRHYGSIPENLRFAAIGHQTAKALALYGVHQVLIPHSRYDSESLLALPEMHDVANLKVAVFRGVGGRELIAETLKSRGADVYFAESYRRVNPQTNTNLLCDLWKQGKLQAVIVTSSEAMRYLLDLAGDSEWLRHVILCVNHARIAEVPLKLGLHVAISDTPGDTALIDALLKKLSKL